MSDLPKLDTANAVMEWARDVRDTERNMYAHLFDAEACAREANDTAAYLARAVRIAQAYDAAQNDKEPSHDER